MSMELNTLTSQQELAYARAKKLSEASNAQLSLICGELTAKELRTIRAILNYILLTQST